MHECAKSINKLNRKLELQTKLDQRFLEEIQSNYEKIIDDCPINHARIDYLLAKFQEKKENQLGKKNREKLGHTEITDTNGPLKLVFRNFNAFYLHSRYAMNVSGFSIFMMAIPFATLLILYK